MTNIQDDGGASFRSEDLFRLVAERVEDFAIFAIDLEGNAASWNPGVEKLLGYSEADFIGRNACIIFTSEDNARDACEREMRAAAERGRAEDRRWHVRKDGSRFWANGLLMALHDDDGTLRGFAKILRDETARKKTEDRLRESEASGRNILESMTNAFYALDREWRFTYVNRHSETLLRRKREELLGKNVWEEFPEAVGSTFYEQFHRAAAGEAVTFEEFYAPLDAWFEVRAYPSPDGLSVYFHNINKRKRAEATLRESQARLALALQAGRAGTFEWDLLKDSNIWSPELEALYGLPPGTVKGNFESWSKRVVPEDARAVETAIRKALAQRRDEYEYEFRAVLPDGTQRWLAGRASFEYDAGGSPVRMIGINVDIDDRKRVEAERDRLLASEREARAEAERQRDFVQLVLDHAPLAIGVMEGAEHRFAFVNPGTEELTGLTRTQFLGRPHAEVVPDADRVVGPILDRVYETGAGETREVAVGLPKGDESHLRVTWTPLPGTNGRPRAVLYLSLDITERKQAETQLRASEERYRTLFASIDEGFCVAEMLYDDDGKPVDYRFVEFNPSFEKLTGIPSEQALSGKTARQLIPTLEDHWIETYGRVVQTGEPIRFVNGSEAMGRWFDVYAFRVGAPEDKKVAILFNNVTEQKRAEVERERLLRDAQEANRLKDEFLATLSHELRTPLTSILGWARLLQTNDFNDAEKTRALQTIERNAQAQAQLIDDLLDTSRIITGKLRLNVRAVDLTSVVKAATETARPAAEAKNIRLQTLLDPQAGPISGDPDRLQQVVWNLLSNAIKFTPKGGRVQVRLERVNSHVEITVADTGDGIPAEFLPHVFDRFRQADQTTTRTHGGLGLGLAIVRQLVELHGGSVNVESEGAGHGTSFTVSLPLLPVRKEPPGDAPRVHPTAQSGVALDCPPELDGLRVLIVDDERDTRELLSAVLSSCGAEVWQAASAAEALQQVELARPDVLVADIGMPGEDGFALLAKIRALPAERGGAIPAAALTAYARVEDRVRALRSGFQMHVPKPVEPAELITVIANLAGRIGNAKQPPQ